MQFAVKRWPVAEDQGWALHWLDDRLDSVCCLVVPQNTVTHWHGAWLALAAEPGGQIDSVVAHASDLFQLDPLHCPLAAISALYGLVDHLQAAPAGAGPHRDAGLAALREFLAERFDFQLVQQGDSASARIVIGAQRYPALVNQPTSTESWLGVFFKWVGREDAATGDADFVERAVASYDFLYASARQYRDAELLGSFVAFSLALAERLERDDRYQPFRRRLDDIYEIVACHGRDLDLARDALVRLLASPGPMASKWQSLSGLLHRLGRLGQGHKSADGSNNDERLATLTGLIADRYLESYDLARAVSAWRQLSLRDPLLGMLLALMDRPGMALALHGGAFALLTALALVQSRAPEPPSLTLPLVGPLPAFQYLGGLLLVLLLAGPAWAGAQTVYRLLRQRLYYVQLVLPRMLAAIVVGLSVLMLDDFPWRITLRLPPLTLFLAAVGVYFFSYLYILLDVYQTIRFDPVPGPAPASRASSTLGHASNVALRVFAIGIVESFLATICVSGVLLPIVFQDAGPGAAPWEGSMLGWIPFPAGPGPATFVFVPALVLLWTGMALFVGAFLQLLWQDSRVTSPVKG